MTEDPFRRISGIIPAAQASYSLDQSPLNKTFEELDGRICKLMEYVKSKNNVHQAIKEQIQALNAKYNKAKKDSNLGEELNILHRQVLVQPQHRVTLK